jgi:hypothetical protein
LQTISSDEGFSIVFNPLSANANLSSHCNFEFDSNLIDVSDLHQKQQKLHTISTDAGISIVFKPLSANAYSSIPGDFEFESNVTDVSDLQLRKPGSHVSQIR